MFSLTIMSDKVFFFGDWQINPSSNSVRNGDVVRTLEPKAMDVLMLLCQQANIVVSTEDILVKCWGGADLGDNPIHKVITQLRKALGDEASNPSYIETIRKRGYRTLAPVVFPVGHEEAVSEGQWANGSPFPGLRAFKETDASVFFGRGEQITSLLKAISSQVRAGHALNIVLGPSGSGKTSLVNAGIIPNLLADHGFDGIRVYTAASVDMADISEERVFVDLASALLDWEVNDEPVFANISADVLAQELQHRLDKIVNLFASVMAEKAANNHHQLLLIDRIEVLLSAPQFSEQTRRHVVRIMEKFARSGAAIVIATCRNDFYPTLAQHPALMFGKSTGAHFDLLPPSRAELLQMIRLPAKHAQLQWESTHLASLDQLLCDDAADNPDALPMLQYTLNELYQQRSEDNVLKLDVYQSLGGIEGAIGKRAEAIVTELSDNVRAALPSIFAKLVTLSNDEKSITSRAALWSQLRNEQEQQLVQTLVDNRLLVSHLVGDEPGFSLAHEALLRKWQRAVDWIQQHRDNLKALSRIQIAAERWQNESEAKEFLLPSGKPLIEAKEIHSNPLFELNETERRFIALSNRRSGFRKTLRRTTVALLAALTLVSIMMTVRSIDSEKRAEQRREQADDLLGYMVGEFADKVRPLGRLDLLGGVSEKALEYLSEDENASPSARLKHAKALQVFAEVAMAKGDVKQAEQAFRSAQATLLQLEKMELDTVSEQVDGSASFQSEAEWRSILVKELGIVSYWLGTLAYNEGRYNDAKPYYVDYLNFSQRYSALRPSDADGLIEQSYAHTNLGTLALKLGKKVAAIEEFNKSLHFSSLAISLSPENRIWQAENIDTSSWLGSTLEELGDLTGAKRIFEDEKHKLKALVKTAPSESRWKSLLANSQIRLAVVHWITGESGLANAESQAASKSISELITVQPENLEYQEVQLTANLLLNHWGLIDGNQNIAVAQNNFDRSMFFYNSGRLNFRTERNYFYAKLNLSLALEAEKRFQESVQLINNLLSELSKAVVHGQDSIFILKLKAQALLSLSRIMKETKNDNASASACEDTVELLRRKASSMENPTLHHYWILAHYCLGKEDEVSENIEWLKEIGYKEPSYNLTFHSK